MNIEKRIKELNDLIAKESKKIEALKDRIKLLESHREDLIDLKDLNSAEMPPTTLSPESQDEEEWMICDRLKITQRIYDHNFNIGEVVKIDCIQESADGLNYYCEKKNGAGYWISKKEAVKI